MSVMESTGIWGAGELTYPGTCRGVQIHVPARLCRARRRSFRLKMLENALFGA